MTNSSIAQGMFVPGTGYPLTRPNRSRLAPPVRVMGLVDYFLRNLILDLIPRKVRRLVGGLFMGIGGIMFLWGVLWELDSDGPSGSSFLCLIGFLVGVIGWLVRGHVNVLLE